MRNASQARRRCLASVATTTKSVLSCGRSATEDRIQTMVIRVASLGRAKAFLRDRQLLGAESVGYVAIDSSKVGGLDIRVVDK